MSSRIALVASSLDGGVWTVTKFIAQVLSQHGGYAFDVVMLATSRRDKASVRLFAPATWLLGVRVMQDQVEETPVLHVGARFAEFEFQRYQPRQVLTDLLNQYDLVQIIAGGPAWAFVTRDILRPVVLFTATRVNRERATLLRQSTRWRRYWGKMMTIITAHIEKQALRRVDVALAESNYTLELLSDYIPADRLTLGPPGVDVRFFSPPLQYAETGYWLWIGRLNDPRKNCLLLLEGYASICRRLPDVPPLVMAGSGEWAPEIVSKTVSLGIAGKVQMYSNVSAARLRELYREASIFVLSSDEEGLGLVILEAMACELPVVSTDCGGPSTAIINGETGFLTQIGDADALANALQVLWENPALRRQMGQAGRKRILEHFSVESAGAIYLQKYEELLGSNNLVSKKRKS